MAVSIKEEGMLVLDPPEDFATTLTGAPETEEMSEDLSEEQAELLKAHGPPADIELEKLPRPVSSLNCRQARSYLVKLLRAANGGQNPQYGNPNSKPPFWPDYYWPWSKLTDVHTKPRGMEEPLLYSEMMKLAIQRGYKYYGYDPENYWDKTVEASEPAPVERGTPAPILSHQVENLGQPPRLPRPNSKLNCVQARTVLSKLLRYQQAGNNPVYGHPETRPPWWPDECIRWSDMVDLRGKPPYLPPDMTYTDVLKHAIDKGLEFFGYNAETWIDDAQYNREMSHSLLSKKPVTSVADNPVDGPPRLPVPINKMNCGLARTSLSRLLRYHCGKNPKYGTLHSMPVWWPNDVFEWTALKNLSHRYDGILGDSYSNCLRWAIKAGYEYYNKDPYTYVEESGDDLPTVAAIKRVKMSSNPQVNEMIQQFDDDIAEDDDQHENDDHEMEADIKPDITKMITPDKVVEVKKKRPPPPLIAIKDISSTTTEETPRSGGLSPRKRKMSGDGRGYGPLLSGRAHTQPGTVKMLRRCRVSVDKISLDHIADEPVSVSGADLMNIARSKCDSHLFEKMKISYDRDDTHCDVDLVFSDGSIRVHKLVLAASSDFLHEIFLYNSEADCVVFPDISLAVGKLAVDALYSGNVKINRRSISSLGCVEKCLRSFQEVGLLTHYSIQLSSMLPLENFNPTRSVPLRPPSPSTPSPPPPAMTEQLSNVLPPSLCDQADQTDVVKNDNLKIVDGENNVDKIEDLKDVEEPKSPRKKSSPSKQELKKDCSKTSSPGKQETRKDCNKPKFSEVTQEVLKEKEAESLRGIVDWLQETGFLCSAPPKCRGCGKLTQLQDSSDQDGVAWKCPSREKCVPGPVSPSLLREHSIFQFSKEKLLWILRIIMCWRENTSLSQCHQETEASIDQIFFWYEKCRQFFCQVEDEDSQ